MRRQVGGASAADIAHMMAERRGDTAAMETIRTMDLPKNAPNTRKQVEFLAEQMTAMRGRPTKQDTEIYQQSPANLFPNSILQTSVMSEVKERVRQLLDDMTTNGKQLFEDADFAPSTPDNMSVLFRQQDIVSAEEAETMKKLKWLRPRQISMKSDLVGFTQINRVGIVDSEFDNMQP